MDRTEKLALIASGGLMAVFAAALLIASFGLDIQIPTCLWDKKPFTKGSIERIGPGHYEVHYVAKMWTFEPAEIEVPQGATLDIYLASTDVHHGFQIPRTNVNLMAVPGAVNFARVRLSEAGKYTVVCHEYCGLGHQNMAATITVTPGYSAGPQGQKVVSRSQRTKGTTIAAGQGILATAQAAPDSAVSAPAVAGTDGNALLQAKGCIACHSTNGQPGVGPTFLKLYGKTETLTDGSTITVDDAYLTESIRQPAAKVVRPYQPVMPAVPLTDEELAKIIETIKNLK